MYFSRRIIKEAAPFLSCIRFLTILPVPGNPPYEPERMAPWFPVCGLFIGSLLAFADSLFCLVWPPSVCGALDTLFLIIITGALHMDGLGDTADGLYVSHSKKKALAVMKDSRIGAMGTVAIICVIMLKWAAIPYVSPGNPAARWLLLAVIPGLSRSSMLIGMRFLPYGRDNGTGKGFFESPLSRGSFTGIGICLVLPVAGWAIGAGIAGLILPLAFFASCAGIIFIYQTRLGCITGDMLGAMTEITETLLFCAAAAGGTAL